MATNTPTGDEPRDDPDDYHPARHVSGEAVGRAMTTLSHEELEAINQDASNAGVDEADRVLVEVSQRSAEYVRRHAWSLDREPGEILDEMIWYAQVHQDDAIDDLGP